MKENTENTERLIKLYFELGLSDSEILSFLTLSHHVIISISTLKRKLRSMRLSRKKDFSDLLEVALFITQELEWSGQLHGYRWMHQKMHSVGIKDSKRYRIPHHEIAKSVPSLYSLNVAECDVKPQQTKNQKTLSLSDIDHGKMSTNFPNSPRILLLRVCSLAC